MRFFSSYCKMAVFATTFFTFTACRNFVEVYIPPSQLTAAAVFDNTATANAAMANVYVGFRDAEFMAGSPSGLSSLMGGYADELSYYGLTGISNEFFYHNTLLATDPMVGSYWNVAYNQIYAANAVLEGVQQSAGIPETEKNRLRGEGLFARAWLHFYLLNLFGDIPYVQSTNYEVNRSLTRLPASQVYALITNDLEQAMQLLPDVYNTVRRIKPNKWVAQAFLARVHLYAGQCPEAITAATDVIDHTALFLLNTNISSVFLRTSTETIWQLQPVSSTANTREAATFIFLQGPPPNTALSSTLMEAFEPDDARRTNWTLGVTNGIQTWFHAYKYKQQSTTTASQENSIMMRLAELYLIRAEALARQGELGAATDDLNTIRQRAGLDDTEAVSQEELLEAILHERQVELFTEHGHRFFDLKRFGKAHSTLALLKPNWDATDTILPIPETELLRNTKLGTQNLGY